MNQGELDIHRRIDIARSRVILMSRRVVERWKGEPTVGDPMMAYLSNAIEELDKVQAEWKQPQKEEA